MAAPQSAKTGVFQKFRQWRLRRAYNLLNHRLQARYAAGQPSALHGSGFTSAQKKINDLTRQYSPVLRARSGYLVRNFPPFMRAVNAHSTFVVGKGARFQSMAVDDKGQPDYPLRALIERRFRHWCEKPTTCGKLHFYEVQQLADRQLMEDGEYVIRFHLHRDKGLRLSFIEPACLSSAMLTTPSPEGISLDQGIEYQTCTGQIQAYHFHDDITSTGYRVPAEYILHGFVPLKPNQLRGVTPFAAAIILASHLGEYMNSELGAAKLAARWLAFITTEDPSGYQQVRNPWGASVKAHTSARHFDDMEEAIIEYLKQNEQITIAPKSDRPGGAFERFFRIVLLMVSIVVDIPYEILSGDYTQLNYTTIRGGRNDFKQILFPHQFRMETHLTNPIFRKWLQTEAMLGHIPGYFEAPWRFTPCLWIPAGQPYIDPLKEGKADIDSMNAGVDDPLRVMLSRGLDPETTLDNWAAFKEMCAARGLNFDLSNISTALVNNPAGVDPELGGTG